MATIYELKKKLCDHEKNVRSSARYEENQSVS